MHNTTNTLARARTQTSCRLSTRYAQLSFSVRISHLGRMFASTRTPPAISLLSAHGTHTRTHTRQQSTGHSQKYPRDLLSRLSSAKLRHRASARDKHAAPYWSTWLSASQTKVEVSTPQPRVHATQSTNAQLRSSDMSDASLAIAALRCRTPRRPKLLSVIPSQWVSGKLAVGSSVVDVTYN